MKMLVAAFVALALTASAPAQKLDLSTVTCKQFLESRTETISLILMWIAGYYADEDDPPIVDFDKMKADGQKLAEYCANNLETGLITAIEQSIMED